MRVPDGFERLRRGRVSVVVRSSEREWLVPVLLGTPTAAAGAVRHLAGGRGGAQVLTVQSHEVVVRACRRGGLPAYLLKETYVGWVPRPFRELWTLETLRRQGVPVVEPLGASVHWGGPIWYKGWLVTRYINGARSLWDWASSESHESARAGVWRAVGKAVRRLHGAGVRHPDLNLRNILLCQTDGGVEVVFVDFDRPWLSGWRPADNDLLRLERSARKLDRAGTWITAADLEQMRAGYAEVEP